MSAENLDEKQLHALVSGRVQGVGFRLFVQREATRRGLNGWVRNLARGKVEVMAQGPRGEVNELLARLREGPALASVDDVRVEWQEPDDSLRGFSLKQTAYR